MGVDPASIRSFLSRFHPFDLLPGEVLTEVAEAAGTRELKAGETLMQVGEKVDHLYIVRSGAMETHTPEGQLLARLSEGDCCGVRALLRGGLAVNRIEALEDSRLHTIPSGLFDRLRKDHPPFAYHFAAFDGGRLKDSMDSGGGGRTLDLLNQPVGALLGRPPVTIGKDATVGEAARLMRDEKVSCVLVMDGEALVGILTDRDLRGRVVAAEMPYSTPVSDVMSSNPRFVEARDDAFRALLLMTRHNIHHLPVKEGGRVAGCLSTSALVQSHTSSPLYLARAIHGCGDPDELAAVMRKAPEMVHQLVDSGGASNSIGHIVTSLTDALTVRLIQLAEAKLGTPPVPYVWLAAGSQGRQEQTALSDQDNAMVLDDAYDAAEHGQYFKELARFVCDGLNTAGYVYCPGEMMAVTDRWRQPMSVWKEYFRKWIEEPEPKALMLSSVFFDLRPVHGPAELFEDLHGLILEKTRKNRIFQSFLAHNALSREPPIGFFRNFVLIRGGDHDHTFDLKLNGVVPIVDMGRVYALAGGIGAVNTFARLEACAEAKTLSREGAQDLLDALEFIGITRLRHQARMMREGRKADNFLSPDELSSFERNHLKAAFTVVKTMQSSMASTYQAGRF